MNSGRDYAAEAIANQIKERAERDQVQRQILACLLRIEQRINALVPPQAKSESLSEEPKP